MAQETSNEVSNDEGVDAIFATLVTGLPLARTPSPSGPRLSPIRDQSQNDESFVYKCFPHPQQHSLRASLWALLQQPWLATNNLEPAGDLQFLLHDTGCGGQKCMICAKVLRRGSRALEHIRAHLGHKPYQCHGGFKSCSFLLCGKLFYSQEAMKDHQRRDVIQCQRCNARVLRKNYGRHQKTKLCCVTLTTDGIH